MKKQNNQDKKLSPFLIIGIFVVIGILLGFVLKFHNITHIRQQQSYSGQYQRAYNWCQQLKAEGNYPIACACFANCMDKNTSTLKDLTNKSIINLCSGQCWTE